ncbi:MAG TPA: hypothetical protein EYQ64_10820 [Gemmatimonadetes bacterium]|nr:hypothetical protein [Gemmatimonadota bacterium]
MSASWRRGSLAVVLSLVVSGCAYSFRAGSFPPEHVNTIAVQPFDNETNRFELSGELYDQLLRNLPRALGIRTAGEDLADAVVRGSIMRYDVIAPNYQSARSGQAAQVLQRQVSIGISVEIVDLVENVVLWESRSLIAQGEFLEASETEEVGRLEAIELLVQKIVDGAQSNW